MKRLLKMSSLLVCLAISQMVFAQKTLKVTGKVTSDEGTPLVGVSVSVKDGNSGISTGADGTYTINVPTGKVIIFSYVGFVNREITINKAQTLNIEMAPANKSLDDVVVIGYGTVKKKDLTGSVSSVKSEEIVQTSPINVEQALQGRAAGVRITSTEGTPDAGLNITIRGASSLGASNAPLYVVDGFPISGDNEGGSVGLGNSTTSPIRGINPSDIESIEVLKDASATAIYGSRGSNGVVIITTKSGKKGIPKVTFETNYGVSKISKYIDVMEGQEFVDYYNELVLSPAQVSQGFIGWQSYRDTTAPYATIPIDQLTVHNWQKEVFRNTSVSDSKLSVSGGNDYTKYYGGIGVTTANGILINSDYTRYSLNFKLDQRIGTRARLGFNITTAYINRNGLVSSTDGAKTFSGVINDVIKFRPVEPRYLYEGADVDQDGNLITERGNEVVNPNLRAEKEIQNQKSYQTLANAFLEIELIKDLKFQTKFGVNYNVNKGSAWYPGEFGWGRFKGGGIAMLNHRQTSGWLNENTLTYDKTFNKNHKINVLAGITAQSNDFEFFQLQGEGFEIPGVNIDNIRSATRQDANLNRSDAIRDVRIYSLLGRVNYNYKGKYLITASIRRDGSTKFAEGNKFGIFPSGAVAWNVAEEDFFADALPIFSTFKLRASYGLTGNQGIPSYQSQATLSPVQYQFGTSTVTGLYSTRLPNNELTWEKTKQFDVGVEIGVMKNRFNLEIDYYDKNTYDLLLQKPVSYVSGFSSIFANIGSMRNKGWEFTLNTSNVKTRNFTWNTNFNISFNKNIVGDLGIEGSDRFFVSGLPYDGSYTGFLNDYIVQTGKPVGSIYGWVSLGTYKYADFKEFEGLSIEQSAALYEQMIANGTPFTLKDGVAAYVGSTNVRPGYMRLADISGADGKPDGKVDENDRTIIGNPTPKHFGGLSNTFNYKGIGMDILFTWSYGNDIYNKNKIDALSGNIATTNQLGEFADRWTPLKETDMYVVNGRTNSGAQRVSTLFIEDGSFLRLQNITFSYSLPRNLVVSKLKMSNVKFYLSLNNLAVWTNYSGFDPEVNVGTNPLTPGIDFASYPRSRNYRAGISVTF